MNIHNFYYNDNSRILHVEFSAKNDNDSVYRIEEINFSDIEYYSPTIINEIDMKDIDENFIIEFLEEFYKYNEMPKEDLL